MVVATAAPAVAASLRKDPGINGWVLNSPQRRSGTRRFYLTVDSTVSTDSHPTPDGAPFGLYLYDANLQDDYTSATITYWINGSQNPISWDTLSGHSSHWQGPVRGGAQTKSDGISYTPYTWTYNATIDPAVTSTQPDGVERVWLVHFRVRATFTQTSGNSNQDLTYWTQRAITVHPGGEGSGSQPQVLTFERRNGTLGPYTQAGARSVQRDSTTQVPDAALHEGVS